MPPATLFFLWDGSPSIINDDAPGLSHRERGHVSSFEVPQGSAGAWETGFQRGIWSESILKLMLSTATTPVLLSTTCSRDSILGPSATVKHHTPTRLLPLHRAFQQREIMIIQSGRVSLDIAGGRAGHREC